MEPQSGRGLQRSPEASQRNLSSPCSWEGEPVRGGRHLRRADLQYRPDTSVWWRPSLTFMEHFTLDRLWSKSPHWVMSLERASRGSTEWKRTLPVCGYSQRQQECQPAADRLLSSGRLGAGSSERGLKKSMALLQQPRILGLHSVRKAPREMKSCPVP